MKNPSLFPAFFALCALVFGLQSCKDKCGNEVSAVQPNTNPSGYEVLLKTNGFTNAAKVVFGTVEATSRAGGNAGEIIARVPAGLSGNVEISVEEGDCIKRSGDFIVSGTLPGNVQPSLPDIIVSVPSSLPQSQTNVINNWVNASDTTGFNYGIHLSGTFVDGACSLEGSYEFNYKDPKFNGNPATGTANNNTNVIYLEVDRTANGGIVEHFDGQFIQVPSVLTAKAEFVIELLSRETGRQLLIYYPK